jgi:peptidyl-dipeptidase Dcp
MKRIFLILTMTGTIFTASSQENPLLKDWKGPYGGVPNFKEYKVSDFESAMKEAIQIKRSEIDAITGQNAAPNFKNTIEALEKSGKKLSQVKSMFYLYGSSLNSSDFETIEGNLMPLLSEIDNEIYQNSKLFERISAVYNGKEKTKLTQEQQRLVWLYYSNFVREGANASDENKKEIAAINKKLAELFTKFSQNLLADETNIYLELTSEEDFQGLPIELKNAAVAEAQERKLNVLGCISNTRSSIEPFLTFSKNRKLRQQAFEIFVNRGDNNNENNNNAVVSEILILRAKKAKLLGFKTFADWSLSNTMAQNPSKTLDLMMSVWEPALQKVKSDVLEMEKLADKEGNPITIEPWDYRYYEEKLRNDKYDLDANKIKEYLQLEKLIDGMFWVAGEVFDLKFKPVTNVPIFHEDVRVWEVTQISNGKLKGLFYFDPYARKGKRSGAWMTAYRDQHKLNGDVVTLVSNNCNFIKGVQGEPVLISWDDATTLFHEFGHALHGLCSDVTYPSLSGTNTPRDYVEFPSQVLERWLSTPEVLNKYALHYKTNEPMPMSLVAKIKEAESFNAGFSTVETISSSIVDMKLHLMESVSMSPKDIEASILKELNMPSQIVMRHRIPQFGHIFSGDDYAAGYYSYLWSDVISADATEAFTVDGKGLFDKKVAKSLLKYVFSVGNTIDPEIAYPKFRGKKANSDALMRSRNFPVNNK